MTASRKQFIYAEILDRLLPFTRNVQTWGVWRRVFLNLYSELELVHNIGQLIIYSEFRIYDIYWLNAQANNYIYECKRNPIMHTSYNEISLLLEELISLVPAEFEAKLIAPEIRRRPKMPRT